MKKPRKLILAEYLESHSQYLTAQQLMQWCNSNDLGVQVKTLDSVGNFVIKFSASDPWIKPTEWLHNYKVSAKARYEEASFIYRSLFPPEQSGSMVEGESTRVVNAYASLLKGLNIARGQVFYAHHYPNDKDRFEHDLIRTVMRFRNLKDVDVMLALTLGLTSVDVLQMDPTVRERVEEVMKAQGNI